MRHDGRIASRYGEERPPLSAIDYALERPGGDIRVNEQGHHD
jgi:hypothetical protein